MAPHDAVSEPNASPVRADDLTGPTALTMAPPPSLANWLRDAGYTAALVVRREDGTPLTPSDESDVADVLRAFARQHSTPGVTAADVDFLTEARKLVDPATGRVRRE